MPESNKTEPNMSEVIILETEELAKRLVSYLDYELGEGASYEEVPEEGFRVLIDEKRLRKAKRCFQAFYTVEKELDEQREKEKNGKQDPDASEEADEDGSYENEENDFEDYNSEDEDSDSDTLEDEDSEEDEEMQTSGSESGSSKNKRTKDPNVFENSSDAPTEFVKKSDQAKELKSTAVTFFVIAVVGTVFLIFNLLGFFPMFDSLISNLVFAFMFIGSFFVAANSLQRAKKAASEITDEETLTKEIEEWLDANVTKEMLAVQRMPEATEEINFLKELNHLKALITAEFGELEETFLDYIAEDYYNRYFEDR